MGEEVGIFFSLYYCMLLSKEKKNHFIFDRCSTFNDKDILIKSFQCFTQRK